MRFRVTERSDLAPPALWARLADVQSWPEWCEAFIAVQPDGPLQAGTGVRVIQPGLRPAVWTVDEVVPGRSFRWSTRGPGFLMARGHGVEPTGSGSTVTLSLTVTGPMGWAVSLIVRRPMRRYMLRQARALAAPTSHTE